MNNKYSRMKELVFRQMKSLFYSWNHSSSYFYLFISVIIYAAFQANSFHYINNINTNELQYTSSFHPKNNIMLISSLIFTVVFLWTGFIWIVYDTFGRTVKTGEFLLFFANKYTRKEILISKIIVLYIEFLIYSIIVFLTILIVSWISYGLNPNFKTAGTPSSYIASFQKNFFIIFIPYIIFTAIVVLPLLVFISYIFTGYWYTITTIAYGIISFSFYLPIIFYIIHASRNNANENLNIDSSVVHYNNALLVMGTFCFSFWEMYLVNLFLPSVTKGSAFFSYILGIIPNNSNAPLLTHSQNLGFGIYLIFGFIGFIVFFYYSQLYVYKKVWIT